MHFPLQQSLHSFVNRLRKKTAYVAITDAAVIIAPFVCSITTGWESLSVSTFYGSNNTLHCMYWGHTQMPNIHTVCFHRKV